MVPLSRVVPLPWASPLGLLFDESIKKRQWMSRVRWYQWLGHLSCDEESKWSGRKQTVPRLWEKGASTQVIPFPTCLKIPSAPSNHFLISLVISIGQAEISKCIAGQIIQGDNRPTLQWHRLTVAHIWQPWRATCSVMGQVKCRRASQDYAGLRENTEFFSCMPVLRRECFCLGLLLWHLHLQLKDQVFLLQYNTALG